MNRHHLIMMRGLGLLLFCAVSLAPILQPTQDVTAIDVYAGQHPDAGWVRLRGKVVAEKAVPIKGLGPSSGWLVPVIPEDGPENLRAEVAVFVLQRVPSIGRLDDKLRSTPQEVAALDVIEGYVLDDESKGKIAISAACEKAGVYFPQSVIFHGYTPPFLHQQYKVFVVVAGLLIVISGIPMLVAHFDETGRIDYQHVATETETGRDDRVLRDNNRAEADVSAWLANKGWDKAGNT